MAVFLPAIWGCVCPPERSAASVMAEASASMFPYVPVFQIDLIFQAHDPGWWEVRKEAWRKNWALVRQDIDIDGMEIEVYQANLQWMTDLWTCELMGDCLQAQPLCLQLRFYNQPEPE